MMDKQIESRVERDKYLEELNACSTTDCTGLIVSGSPSPGSEEADAYNDIYQYEPQSMVARKE